MQNAAQIRVSIPLLLGGGLGSVGRATPQTQDCNQQRKDGDDPRMCVFLYGHISSIVTREVYLTQTTARSYTKLRNLAPRKR